MNRPLQSSRTTASLLVTGLDDAVIVIAAGCGSSAATPAVPDPCAAVPAADVARITHLAAAAAITLYQRSHTSAICE